MIMTTAQMATKGNAVLGTMDSELLRDATEKDTPKTGALNTAKEMTTARSAKPNRRAHS